MQISTFCTRKLRNMRNLVNSLCGDQTLLTFTINPASMALCSPLHWFVNQAICRFPLPVNFFPLYETHVNLSAVSGRAALMVYGDTPHSALYQVVLSCPAGKARFVDARAQRINPGNCLFIILKVSNVASFASGSPGPAIPTTLRRSFLSTRALTL